MVTKHIQFHVLSSFRLNLAKIHMVTKPNLSKVDLSNRLNLAKIHMVTKLAPQCCI